MHLTYTPEQDKLRGELREYFAGLMTPERRAGPDQDRRRLRRRRRLPRGRQAARRRRLAHAQLAGRVRRPAGQRHRSADLHRRGSRGRRARPVPDHQHCRADDHAVRYRRAEVVLPAQDRRRGAALLDRLLRARGGDRPGPAADHGGARRRRLRDQRPEDVDVADRLRGLRLAGLPDRPGRAAAQGPVDHHRADQLPRLLLDPGADRGRGLDQRDLLLRRPSSGREPGRRGEPGLAADHQPAQPRTGRAHVGRADAERAARGAGLGGEGSRRGRIARDRRRVGPDAPGPRARARPRY